MLSSQSERDGQRNWFALGPGTWDREQRPSWVRLDRVLTVEAHGIRREGAVLDRARFDLIAAQLRKGYGWAGPRRPRPQPTPQHSTPPPPRATHPPPRL